MNEPSPDESRAAFRGRRIGVTVERWARIEREIVEHPGAVVIVPVDGEGYVTLVRQFRAPARRELLELPAGTLEPGEEPLATARRELAEETGLSGGTWRAGPVFWTTPGFSRERMHLFVAEGVERGKPSPAADESIELVRWSLTEVPRRLAEIEDAKTLVGLLLYLADADTLRPP
jgi:ADP-ribose pyrophosphatase